jgi:hypothetical protein
VKTRLAIYPFTAVDALSVVALSASRTKPPTTNKEIATMTHQQVIQLVEKYLADNDSVTTDELKRANTAAYTADVAAYAANANYGIGGGTATGTAAAAAAAAVSAAIWVTKISMYVKQYHEQLAEQAK